MSQCTLRYYSVSFWHQEMLLFVYKLSFDKQEKIVKNCSRQGNRTNIIVDEISKYKISVTIFSP